MIIGNTIINPAQVVYVTRDTDTIYVTVTSVLTQNLPMGQNVDNEVLEFTDPDGDLFAVLAKEIERLSPPRPV